VELQEELTQVVAEEDHMVVLLVDLVLVVVEILEVLVELELQTQVVVEVEVQVTFAQQVETADPE
jgi:hypothetical protein